MSDALSAITQKEMMRQLYALQKESVENDARLQSQMEEVIRQLDMREKTFEKLREEIEERKSFFLTVENINEKLSEWNKKLSELNKKFENLVDWKNEQEKLNVLEVRDNKAIDGKFERLFEWKEKTDKRIGVLENKGAQTTFVLIKKIGGIVLTMIVTAITAYLIGRFK